MEKDNNILGSAPVSKLLRMFSIPCVLSLVISALYNLVDQIFIGHKAILGADGNAATGVIYGLTVIALGFGLWIGDGAASLMAISQGKNDTTSTAKRVGNSITLGVIMGVLLTFICFIFKDSILPLLGGTGNILTLANDYSFYIFIGFTVYIVGSLINPIIRADGSPIFAMVAMSLGAIVNIILDPIMLYVFDMGMEGAALATLIGQVVTFIVSIAYLFRAKTFKLKFSDFILRRDFTLVYKYGISSFLTQFSIFLITAVNNAILKEISINSGYSPAITMGAITLAFKVFGIIVSVAIGIVSGGAPIIGYNYGARKYDRVKEALKLIIICAAVVGIIATILFEACPKLFLLIFGDGGDSVDKASYEAFVYKTFRIYLALILPTVLIKVISVFFQAIAMPVKSTLITSLRDVIFLIPLAVSFGLLGGVDLFLWSAPIADLLGLIVAVSFLIPELKKLGKKEDVINEINLAYSSGETL